MIIKGSDINGSQWSFPVQYLNRGITGSSSVPCPMTPEQMNAIWRVIGTAMWSSGDYGTHTTLVQEVIDG
ncbi:hypothetical protein [Candidatus Liberibacter sp.]|uniref:hypothetical protein n=1 Tax=Candidatus Liberibacter sp. TaxID=34022 RepID=UPI0015F3A4A0|nr:hypothetical protein [Candidatus Liberibacter sp.]MBA5724641.1 hypothetical protein [Candidatus Liberibacter sp.]